MTASCRICELLSPFRHDLLNTSDPYLDMNHIYEVPIHEGKEISSEAMTWRILSQSWMADLVCLTR